MFFKVEVKGCSLFEVAEFEVFATRFSPRDISNWAHESFNAHPAKSSPAQWYPFLQADYHTALHIHLSWFFCISVETPTFFTPLPVLIYSSKRYPSSRSTFTYLCPLYSPSNMALEKTEEKLEGKEWISELSSRRPVLTSQPQLKSKPQIWWVDTWWITLKSLTNVNFRAKTCNRRLLKLVRNWLGIVSAGNGANDVITAQEAMQKFNIEKVLKFRNEFHEARQLTNAGNRSIHQERGFLATNWDLHFRVWPSLVWCPKRRDMALHRRKELRQLCDARYSISTNCQSIIILMPLARDQAFHLLLPRTLCHSAFQDTVGTSLLAWKLSFSADLFGAD